MTTPKVQIVCCDDLNRARAFTPYEALSVLKDAVPSFLRRWDAERKCWLVDESTVLRLADALTLAGWSTFVTTPDGRPWTPPKRRHDPRTDPPGGTTGSRRTPAPVDWVTAAFDACPPGDVDRLGGDGTLAQRINEVADACLRRAARRAG